MKNSGEQSVQTVEPLKEYSPYSVRKRLGLKGELLLAALPTAMVLIVFSVIETLSQQRLLFASLASSAFLIYLDPSHSTNTAKSLALSHSSAALSGAIAFFMFGAGYVAAALAMISVIIFMVTFDVVHPPAVSTALGFSFRPENISGIGIFFLAVTIICLLILLQRALLWTVTNTLRKRSSQ